MKKMKKTKLMLIIFVSVLVFATLNLNLQITKAIDVVTYPYLVVTPNPAYKDNPVSVVMWLHGAPPSAAGLGGDRYQFKIRVLEPNLADIDSNWIYIDEYGQPTNEDHSFISDETGSTYAKYTPDTLGTYKFKLIYPGQTIARENPEGPNYYPGYPFYNPIGPSPTDYLVGATFLPSSTILEVEVLDPNDLNNPPPKLELSLLDKPEEYWTHPIEGQNTEWYKISSNWLAGAHIGQGYGAANAMTRDLFQRDGTAPETPHIMWTKPIEFGGIVGGTTEIPGIGFYSGGSYEARFTNAIIMSGRLYYQVPLYHSGGTGSSASGYACVDLRTGETIWTSDEIGIPSKEVYGLLQGPTIKGQLYDYETVNQHGVVGGLIWTELGSTWMGYDAFTGQWVYNITNVPRTILGQDVTEVYTQSGEIERYILASDNPQTTNIIEETTLSLWTSSATRNSTIVGEKLPSFNPQTPGTTADAFQYRPMGKNADMSENYLWENYPITYQDANYDLPGNGKPTIVKILPGDLILGTSTSFPIMGINGISRIPPSIVTMWAINLDPGKGNIGKVLWIKDIDSTEDLPDHPGNYLTRTLGPVYVGPNKENTGTIRIFTMSNAQNFTWFGYNLDNGQLEWGPKGGDSDFLSDYQYYGSAGGSGQIGYVAYGRLYVDGYGGKIFCYDLKDGSLLWDYSTADTKDLEDQMLICETNTVWGYFPIFIAGIAEGKVYVYNNEHSPNNPYYKGERVRCIDAFTGDELWNLMGMAGQSLIGSTSIIADGYLCYYNFYDNQIYCIGKGPTKTTVTAPNTEIPKKSSVLIQGSVFDISQGAMQDEPTKRFPHGLPAISDENMSAWMEYVYMQKPYPEKITGVEVNLTVIDPNDNSYQIGTVISEPSGAYALDFTPSDSGLYKIIATFQGSDSYWPSYAETFILVEGKNNNPKQTSNVNTTTFNDSLSIIALLGTSIGIGIFATKFKK